MRHKRYTYFITCFILFSCTLTEEDYSTIPPIEYHYYPSICFKIDTLLTKETTSSFNLLGCGYDCKFSPLKGNFHVKNRIIDVNKLLKGEGYDYINQLHIQFPPSEVNKAILYESGYTISVISNTSDIQIARIMSLYGIKTYIQGCQPYFFRSITKDFIDNPSEDKYFTYEYLRPTCILTLPNIYPQYLQYFLSDKFIEDLYSKSADDIVKTYGTHLLTDITLGGWISVSAITRLTPKGDGEEIIRSMNLYYNHFYSSHYSTNNGDKYFPNCDRLLFHIHVTGGIPSTIKIKDNQIIGFQEWMQSINSENEQIIDVGNIKQTFPLSDFIVDTTKKKEIEEAIIRYCEKQKVDMLSTQTFDYEEGVIYYNLTTNNKNYLLAAYDIDYSWGQSSSNPAYLNRYPTNNQNPWEINNIGAWRVRWTFYPYGEYYRIGTRLNDGRDIALAIGQATLPFFNDNTSDQLWEIESVMGQKDIYMLKHINSGQYLCSTDHKLHPKNPNDKTLWFNIKITN